MSRKPATKKALCHIHDKVQERQLEKIRQDVCVNDYTFTKHTDGKHYCLFHLPIKEKDIHKFEQIFQARLKAVEENISEIEKLPEDKQTEIKKDFSYDFRYVWFPSKVNLSKYKFQVTIDFRWAKFSANVDFGSAIFMANAYFESAIFADEVDLMSAMFAADGDFRLAKFSATAYFSAATFAAAAYFMSTEFVSDANFTSAIFSAEANFRSATFFSDAEFRSATFAADADFKSAIFSAYANFISAKFLETSQIFFQQTRFCKLVDFNYSVFAGYVAFEGRGNEYVFLNKEEENQTVALGLQNARLENPERISFHRVRLCPSWFVNVDSRSMVFTDVSWNNLDRKFRNPNITVEIESLEKRKISEPLRLLEIACRQLGVNAEENNLYEDASKFRFMAMETKRLEYAWKGRFWTLSWWYRLSSDYGENSWRAFLILLGILVMCAVFYNSPFANFEMTEKKQTTTVIKGEIDTSMESQKRPEFYKMNNLEGFVHSLYVAALQRPEPKAAEVTTRLFVILETIFAPLQAALLALAIRRKFMR